MKLSRHETPSGPRWAADGCWLAKDFSLNDLLTLSRAEIDSFIDRSRTALAAQGPLLAPIEPGQEVWASGVTYQRSRDAREVESSRSTVYDRVYSAERPELFFKANGWRVVGPQLPVRIRADSEWNVPEPELTLVINCHGEIIGYTAGNDMSSRSIEGENPLYLPQAKIYNGSCALGPAIELTDVEQMREIPIQITIERTGQVVYRGSSNTSNINRPLKELTAYLYRELSFPHGAFLLTGTGIVPPETFTLAHGDIIHITVGDLFLTNPVGV
jgi:2-dehydro-3-deoxy-D-arabinonate dehydratase